MRQPLRPWHLLIALICFCVFAAGCGSTGSSEEANLGVQSGVAMAAGPEEEVIIESTEAPPTVEPSATSIPFTLTPFPTNTSIPTAPPQPTITPIPTATMTPTTEVMEAASSALLVPIIGEPIQAVKMFVNCGSTRTEYRFRGNRSGNEIPACDEVTEMWAYGLQPSELISLGTIAFSRDVTYKRLDSFAGGIAILNPNSPIEDENTEPSTMISVLCDGSPIAIVHFYSDSESAEIDGPCDGEVTIEGSVSTYGILEYSDASYASVLEVTLGEALQPVGFPIILLYGEYNDNYSPSGN